MSKRFHHITLSYDRRLTAVYEVSENSPGNNVLTCSAWPKWHPSCTRCSGRMKPSESSSHTSNTSLSFLTKVSRCSCSRVNSSSISFFSFFLSFFSFSFLFRDALPRRVAQRHHVCLSACVTRGARGYCWCWAREEEWCSVLVDRWRPGREEKHSAADLHHQHHMCRNPLLLHLPLICHHFFTSVEVFGDKLVTIAMACGRLFWTKTRSLNHMQAILSEKCEKWSRLSLPSLSCWY